MKARIKKSIANIKISRSNFPRWTKLFADVSGWVTIDGQKMYGKVFRRQDVFSELVDVKNLEIVNARMINELVIAELFKQIDVPVVDFYPVGKEKVEKVKDIVSSAKLNKNVYKVSYNANRLFSKNFLQQDEELLFLNTNLTDTIKNFKNLQKQGYKMDLEELETNLFKILVLDLLTLQTDRNARNFPIIINFKEKYLKMGKMFDNEMAFAQHIVGEYKNFEKTNGFDVKSIIKENDNYIKNNSTYVFTIDGTQQMSYKEMVEEVINFASHHEKFNSIFTSILANINLDKACKNLAQKGIKIDAKYVKWIDEILNFNKRLLQAHNTSQALKSN